MGGVIICCFVLIGFRERYSSRSSSSLSVKTLRSSFNQPEHGAKSPRHDSWKSYTHILSAYASFGDHIKVSERSLDYPSLTERSFFLPESQPGCLKFRNWSRTKESNSEIFSCSCHLRDSNSLARFLNESHPSFNILQKSVTLIKHPREWLFKRICLCLVLCHHGNSSMSSCQSHFKLSFQALIRVWYSRDSRGPFHSLSLIWSFWFVPFGQINSLTEIGEFISVAWIKR